IMSRTPAIGPLRPGLSLRGNRKSRPTPVEWAQRIQFLCKVHERASLLVSSGLSSRLILENSPSMPSFRQHARVHWAAAPAIRALDDHRTAPDSIIKSVVRLDDSSCRLVLA